MKNPFTRQRLNAVPGTMATGGDLAPHQSRPESPDEALMSWMGDTLLQALRLSPNGRGKPLSMVNHAANHAANIELAAIWEITATDAERVIETIRRANVLLCGEAYAEPDMSAHGTDE